ncbi:MAG: Fic/DOC family N-terminal domain-containing protein [Actinomycetaceae bacterium]|nr:Fic family protein [Arcanobacterium sp.]MDD7687380.1 Fic/DOC family N-terminal domain-containing protein [Actinomycetaceae bacterium]MDY5273531.1 Fic/DOC family N-terminal domain-containing protein [Arcanobacterium sp.]
MYTSPDLPYRDLPPLPPAQNIETASVLKATIGAARALAGANAAANLLPNPHILIQAVPLLEAQASNEIENIVTTNDELFRAAHNVQSPSPATKEALRYSKAIYAGYEMTQKKPLTTNTAKLICSTITGIDMDVRSEVSTYIGNPATKDRIYTPPEGKNVILDHMAHWEKFLNEDAALDPLIKLALLHYQFEAIHPFADGNGRTGRILNVLYLVQEGLLKQPVTYLSGYIVAHKDEYYRLLGGVTQRDEWESWILFMLDAVKVTSTWTSNLVYAIREQIDSTVRTLQKEAMPARDFAYMLFEKPYLRYSDIMKRVGVSRPTAGKYAQKLAELGTVEPTKVGRTMLFINDKYLSLLFNTKLPQ